MKNADPGIAQALRNVEFRRLWVALGASIAGDQFARVAIAVLVFARTHSPFVTAASYALTYVPTLLGAPLLSPLGDRMSRRRLMIGLDLARGGLAAAMAIPGLPLWAVLVLLTLLASAQPTFDSSRAATMPDLLGPELYPAGQSLIGATVQIASFAAFPVGALLAATLGPRPTLLVDAATFLVSAVYVAVALRGVDAARTAASTGPESWRASLSAGARAILRDRGPRRVVALVLFGAVVSIVPEGLAVPLAHQTGHGTVAVGLIMAAPALGSALGVLAMARWSVRRRADLLLPQALLSCAALLPIALTGWLPAVIALVGLCGFGTAFVVSAQILLVPTLPPGVRARAVAFVVTANSICTGLALFASGAVAEAVRPTLVVAGTGAVTALATIGLVGRDVRRPRSILDDTLRAEPGQEQEPVRSV